MAHSWKMKEDGLESVETEEEIAIIKAGPLTKRITCQCDESS